jgi:hypothetical protein
MCVTSNLTYKKKKIISEKNLLAYRQRKKMVEYGGASL